MKNAWASVVASSLPWIALATASAAELPQRAAGHGVVIEEVIEGSALAAAGLRAGDMVLAWERLPGPPAHPDGAGGEITSVFEWAWLEVEQAPRGTITLAVERHGEQRFLAVAPGLWEAKARPWMPPDVLAAYAEGRELVAAGEWRRGIDRWIDLSRTAEKEEVSCFHSWFFLRIGDVWARRRAWEEAHALYREALGHSERAETQVVVWNAIGDAYRRQEKYGEAFDAYRSKREIWQAHWGKGLGFAQSQAELGSVARRRDELAAAEEHLRDALGIQEELAPASTTLARTLRELGVVALARQTFEAAEEYLKSALVIFDKLDIDTLHEADALHSLATLSRLQDKLDSAEDLDKRALAIREELAPRSLQVAYSLENLGFLALHRGQLAVTEERFRASLIIREKIAPQSSEVARSLIGLGIVAGHRSEYDTAEKYERRGLAIAEKLAPDSRLVSVFVNNLGDIAVRRGDFELAEEYFQRALTIQEKSASGTLNVSICLTNLGLVAFFRGELDVAEEHYRRALAIDQRLSPDGRKMATSLQCLAELATERSDLLQAEDYYRQSLSIIRDLAPDSLYEAENLDHLGVIARLRGELDLAEDLHRRALTINEEAVPGSLMVAETLDKLGLVAAEKGDLPSARGYLRRALALKEGLAPNSIAEASTLRQLAALYRRDRRPGEAIQLADRAVEALEAQIVRLGGSQDVKAGFRRKHGDIYLEAIELNLELGRPVAAFHYLERSRARSFLAMLAERDLVFSADVPAELERARRLNAFAYDAIRQQMAELEPGENEEEIDRLLGELRRLHKERDDVAVEIRRSSPRLAALRYPRPLDLAAVQETLDPGTLMLSYSVGETRSALFAVSRTDFEVFTLALGEGPLRREVDRFRRLIVQGRSGSRISSLRRGEIDELGRRLFRILIQPAGARVAASERLVVVPDGPLHLLPFAALVREVEARSAGEKQGRYLVELKPIHTVLSATVYAELKRSRPPAAGSRALLAAFGDPHYPLQLRRGDSESITDARVRSAVRRGVFDWDSLPYSRREVEQIAALYPAAARRTYLGREATEERAKAVDARILHFAVHGYLDDRLPLDSALALTIPDELGEDRDNGLLQAWEIFERVRLDADLVVLSACASGLGQELGGEGLIGLTRAFQYAGARTVAASLWNVDDQLTAGLMALFYRHLRDGKPKDEALRAAQIELIRGPVDVADEHGRPVAVDASAPYYWAAFQLFGDWR